jgi:hypothetical protein
MLTLESQGKASNIEKFVEGGYISPKVVSIGEMKNKKPTAIHKGRTQAQSSSG